MQYEMVSHWGPFLERPETFRAHFGSHNSLCIVKAKASRGTKLCSYFNLYFLYKLWKDQLYRISGSQFYEWLFGPKKFSGLSRNASSSKNYSLFLNRSLQRRLHFLFIYLLFFLPEIYKCHKSKFWHQNNRQTFKVKSKNQTAMHTTKLILKKGPGRENRWCHLKNRKGHFTVWETNL